MCATKTNGVAIEQAIIELVEFVQANSPFYAHAWRDIGGGVRSLSNIPVVDHASFWESNTCRNSKVVTSQQTDGIIFKTGGKQKTQAHVSFYSRGELERVSQQLAEGLSRCGVQAGDLIANLFYAGDLYGSFLLHILSVYHLTPGAIQIPIAGHVSLESMEAHIVEFEASVILGTVTTMAKLAERILDAGKTHPYVRLLLFSGEAFYADQAGLLREAFPNAAVKSLIYGSMDCGVIGLPPGPDVTNANNDPRLHQVNSPGIVVEILDGDGQAITSSGEAGRLIVTNVERRLMPIVRYPAGDRAAWVDATRGLFRILDRDRTAIRLGPVSVDFLDLRRVVAAAMAGLPVGALQAVVSREDRRDKLTLAVAYTPASEEQGLALQDAIREGLDAGRPMFKEHVNKGLIASLGVRFVSAGELAANPRSGKAVEVLDIRSTTV
ncbi:hypothetical protein PG999_010784 [Apiospora kogelbergensis]|uniref:Phenylacetate-CoA ligase n=1 Tax=Apiospora kogelbergensis TaxID=1337665 RepID=A0AAW0QB41_9PEZI